MFNVNFNGSNVWFFFYLCELCFYEMYMYIIRLDCKWNKLVIIVIYEKFDEIFLKKIIKGGLLILYVSFIGIYLFCKIICRCFINIFKVMIFFLDICNLFDL